ncbi:MAG: hypothetical protein CMJ64_26855 [Planctomycetaceae bacterium]|nr:hypothetical protein [Planctomycetaceae bacterium]
MLTCYNHTLRLPNNDLTYLAFRLAVQETLSDLELSLDLNEEPDPPTGFLTEVPFLEQVPLPVQIDLLAATWAQQRQPRLIQASLLDAAIIYAACTTASRLATDSPELVIPFLVAGPRNPTPRALQKAQGKMDDLFDEFWDDQDFLMVSDFQDMHPDQARQLKQQLGLPDEYLQPLYDALGRGRVSGAISANLQGLLTDEEIQDALPLIRAPWPPEARLVNDTFCRGIEDEYHGLLIGPCDEVAAEQEADCRFIVEISAAKDGFDCSYTEWIDHLREDVHRIADQHEVVPVVVPGEDKESIRAAINQAQSAGLMDGTRIVSRDDGWGVVDEDGYFLEDPNVAAWVHEDDEDLPAMVFSTAEEAYSAYRRSCAAGKARMRRREEALKRISNGE